MSEGNAFHTLQLWVQLIVMMTLILWHWFGKIRKIKFWVVVRPLWIRTWV